MTRRPLYFISWWCDSLLIGGLSIIAWLGLRSFYGTGGAAQIQGLATGLALLVNYPHFSATIYRLYQRPENLRQFPVTAWVVPMIIAGAVCACLWQPEVVAPYFLMLYLLWSPYHYSGQTIGITMVYSRRAGFLLGRRERMALSAFVYAAFVCAVLRLQAGASDTTEFFGMAVPIFATPAWMYAAAAAVMWTGALVFSGFVFVWCIRQKRLLPPIVLVPAAAHFTWFVAGNDIQAFIAVVPVFHGLQYLLVALAMQLKLRIDGDGGGEHSWRRVRDEVVRWWSRNLIGGALLFLGLPALFWWVPASTLSVAGILAAAVNIHHFFVDGVIWKLRDPLTAAALSTTFAELGGAPAAAPAMARS